MSAKGAVAAAATTATAALISILLHSPKISPLRNIGLLNEKSYSASTCCISSPALA